MALQSARPLCRGNLVNSHTSIISGSSGRAPSEKRPIFEDGLINIGNLVISHVHDAKLPRKTGIQALLPI
ncbi:MAG: hypothetical protein JNN26_11330 [Candidatus Obscuribacter sp.]|nr:hypothetical protein [Candidatus Obscuribacter sp.]